MLPNLLDALLSCFQPKRASSLRCDFVYAVLIFPYNQKILPPRLPAESLVIDAPSPAASETSTLADLGSESPAGSNATPSRCRTDSITSGLDNQADLIMSDCGLVPSPIYQSEVTLVQPTAFEPIAASPPKKAQSKKLATQAKRSKAAKAVSAKREAPTQQLIQRDLQASSW